MAGGPRKFSEKIALLNQKEAEGNAAFDSIMVEVKAIVSVDLKSKIFYLFWLFLLMLLYMCLLLFCIDIIHS